MSYKIYLSPANHKKSYYYKKYNEKQQMEIIAPLLFEELKKYEGLEPIMTTVFDGDGQYTGRPEEARSKNCDIYVALHSNAGGGKGACLFYHPAYELSKALALSLVGELNRVCPIKSNRAVQPAIYPWSLTEWNLGELREPAKYGMAPVLIEHEFHDTPDGATWLVNNSRTIAEADARAIAATLGAMRKTLKGDFNGDGKVDSFDASLVLKYEVGLIDADADTLSRVDMNGDGKVNSLDASLILRKEAGLIK